MKNHRVAVKGKYYVILKDSKGRMIDRRKWGKGFLLKDADKQVNHTGSLHPDLIITKLTNVYERKFLNPYDKKARIRTGSYQWYYEIMVGSGESIHARSMQHPYNYPKKLARKEARDNALGILSYQFTGTSDKKVAIEILAEKGFRVYEGIIRYS